MHLSAKNQEDQPGGTNVMFAIDGGTDDVWTHHFLGIRIIYVPFARPSTVEITWTFWLAMPLVIMF